MDGDGGDAQTVSELFLGQPKLTSEAPHLGADVNRRAIRRSERRHGDAQYHSIA